MFVLQVSVCMFKNMLENFEVLLWIGDAFVVWIVVVVQGFYAEAKALFKVIKHLVAFVLIPLHLADDFSDRFCLPLKLLASSSCAYVFVIALGLVVAEAFECWVGFGLCDVSVASEGTDLRTADRGDLLSKLLDLHLVSMTSFLDLCLVHHFDIWHDGHHHFFEMFMNANRVVFETHI